MYDDDDDVVVVAMMFPFDEDEDDDGGDDLGEGGREVNVCVCPVYVSLCVEEEET